jgi:hypothetical protein
MTRLLPKLLLCFLGLFLGACQPAGIEVPLPDDDDTTDDDDSAGSDDDDTTGTDDDDTTGTDDDDSLGGEDFIDAYVPDYADCSGNRFKLVLGDGTELGPFEGFFDSPKSFANNFPQFTIRTGEDAAWTALNGNYNSLAQDTDIALASPPSVEGNVVLQASLASSSIGTAPADLAGNYGMPASNLHASVGGFVQFSSLPAPNVQTTGSYSGIIQKIVSLSSQQVLLGVRGCFDALLVPTDGG